MEQHHCPKGLQVVNQIRSPIVDLELGKLEVQRDWFLHDHLRERRVSADVLTVSSGSMAELFNPLVHLLKLLIQDILSIANLEGLLTEQR